MKATLKLPVNFFRHPLIKHSHLLIYSQLSNTHVPKTKRPAFQESCNRKLTIVANNTNVDLARTYRKQSARFLKNLATLRHPKTLMQILTAPTTK